MKLTVLLISFLARTFVGFGSVRAECPHLINGLEPWSNANTWPQGILPSAGSNIVIPNGKKILVDTSPPDLGSITIERGGQLVWSPAGSFEIRTGYILISGRLDIGSEDCQFDGQATITLIGKIGEAVYIDGFGRKFVGVAEGGTLELHGKDPSPSWTKLTKTVHSSVSNGAVNITTPMDRGLNVVLFDQKGTKIAKKVFDFILGSTVETDFINFLNAQASGTIMAASVYDATNFNDAMSNGYFTTMQAWGAIDLNKRDYRDSYAMIGVNGGTAVESYSAAGNGPSEFITRNFTLSDGSVFRVGVQLGGAQDGLFIKIESQIFINNAIIDLLDDVSWKAGDKIVLASTDFSPYQSEEATLIECPECTSKQVKLSAQPQYMHWGEITDCVDERGEVGLLTRNILIRGEVENNCYGMTECAYIPGDIDLFGGHLKAMMGFENVHIESVEFYKMGQQVLGSYPVHFHLCGDVDELGGYSQPAYVKKCSIHRSLSRCITMHQTNGLLVQDNVAFDHLGHCMFLEDGIEMRNVIDGNLAILTRFGTVLPTDRNCATCTAMANPQYPNPSCTECLALSTYWMTNPNNILTNNVAAGSEFVGIWYIFPERPTGDSEALGIQLGINPSLTALAKFENNTSHSNKENGLFFEDGINADDPTPEDKTQRLGKFPYIRYNPRVDYKNRDSARAPAIVKGYIGYKNGHRGAWARGGDIWFENSVFADNAIGLTLASDGEMPNDYGSHQAISGGLFVGKTANYGQKMDEATWDPVLERTMPNEYTNWPQRGFELYDGPLRLEHLGFKGFLVDERNNASAFGNFLLNNWQAATSSYVTDLKFFDDSRRLYHGLEGQPWFDVNSLDGDKNPIILDLDGSLTGIANSNVVRNNPFFTSYNCYAQPQWEAQVCKEKFGQLYITNEDPDATNFNGLTMTADSSTASSILFAMTRDEYSDYDLELMGTPPYSAPPRIRFQPLVMLSKSYTIQFKHPTPPALSFQLTNWDQNDWARIGICFPPSTFTVTKTVGLQVTTLTSVNTIQEVDSSDGGVYYYDSTNGLIFFKAVAKYGRNQYDFCSTEGCETYKIVAVGGKLGQDYPCTPYPTYAKTPMGCDGSSGRIDKCGVCNGNGSGCSDAVHELQCSEYVSRSPTPSNNNNSPSNNNNQPSGQVSGAIRSTVSILLLFSLVVIN